MNKKMIYGIIVVHFERIENGKRHVGGVFKYKKRGKEYCGSWKYGIRYCYGEFLMI